jgi:hypothetical protein
MNGTEPVHIKTHPEKEVWSPAKNDLSMEVLNVFCTRETFLWSVLKVDSNSRCTSNLTII